MNDDLELGSLLSGANYEKWLESGPVSFGDMPMEMTEEMSANMNARFGSFNVEEAYGDYRFEDGRLNPVALQRQIKQRLQEPTPGDPMYLASRAPVNEGKMRLESLKQNPHFRSRMLRDENVALLRPLHGLEANDDLTDEIKDAAINMAMDPAEFRKYQEERFKFFADNNMYMAEFMDNSVIGQALEMKGMDPDEVYKQLREEIFRSVALHEIGHTVGMSHNFEGSQDALNYQDDFWEIRAERDQADWNEARLPEYRYSTIMEYGSRFNANNKGLGKYDYAAIKFAYGGHTERFDASVNLSSSLNFEVFANGYERIPDLLGGDYRNISKRVDVSVDEQTSLDQERPD